jgi:hypothetical protein
MGLGLPFLPEPAKAEERDVEKPRGRGKGVRPGMERKETKTRKARGDPARSRQLGSAGEDHREEGGAPGDERPMGGRAREGAGTLG